MRAVFITLSFTLLPALFLEAQIGTAQSGAIPRDTSNIVFFDNRFQAERDVQYAAYYGTPRKIGDNRYEVIFYTLSGQKFAMGEYLGANLRNRNGIFVRYDLEGRIILSVPYHRSLMHGVFQRWHLNGNLADSGEVERNYNIGMWKSWHPNGQLREIKYFKLMKTPRNQTYSMLNGEYRSWDQDGRIKDSGLYKGGYKNGVWIEWVQNAELRSLGIYKKGWKAGDWKFYDKTGKFLYIRRYKKNHYDPTGELIRINN